jgi:hypothetical protein
VTLSANGRTQIWLAHIRRFHWEDGFFAAMREHFDSHCLHTDGDVELHAYTRKSDLPHVREE